MKPLLLASLSVTSAVATGALLMLTGAELAVAYVAQEAIGIGASTPISGITIGVVIAGALAGIGFLWHGAKQMMALGGFIADLRSSITDGKAYLETLKMLNEQVDANTTATAKNAAAIQRNTETLSELDARMAAHERWRQTTDPIVAELQIRAGLRRRPGTKEADG